LGIRKNNINIVLSSFISKNLTYRSSIDDVYVKSLELRDAQIVFDYWPYKSSTSVENIADELIQLPSAGVYLKATDQLVAWMNFHPPNGMSRLHTLEQHRRKGYATLLTRYLSKRVAQSGHSPYVLILVGNTASERFFQHLGFHFQSINYINKTHP
jgi:GNAT superfamily N-acetyltransferase